MRSTGGSISSGAAEMRITPERVLSPSVDLVSWIDRSISLRVARDSWVATPVLALVAFLILGRMHAGEFYSLMIAVMILSATATSLAPTLDRAFVVHAVVKLRRRYSVAREGIEEHCRLVDTATRLACVGIWSTVFGYNILALAVIAAWSGQPLWRFLPHWHSLSIGLIAGGWSALILGEHRMLRVLRS